MGSKQIIFMLSFGHGQDEDPGAVSGSFVERNINEEAMDACNKYLLKHRGKKNYKVFYSEKDGKGRHIAKHVADSRSLAKKYRVVAIDFHMNAGGGDGAECYITNRSTVKSRQGRVLSQMILAEFKKIGQNSRGIKIGNDLAFLKCSGVPVLVEGGFVDNKTDRKLFNTKTKQKKLGIAVAKALIKYYNEFK